MNIVITGTSKGIGFNLLKSFLENSDGENSVFAISRNIENQLLLTKQHINLFPIKCDITKKDDLDKACKFIEDKCNCVDILINNAGVLINKPFIQITEDDIDHVFNSNFKGPFLLIKQLYSLLAAASNPHIVNISSMGGFQGAAKFPGLSIYSSSKAALTCLSECLAVEFNSTAIKINALCIGAVQTEMLTEAFPGYTAKTSPQEMADFIYHFATKNHFLMNGKVIPVALSNP